MYIEVYREIKAYEFPFSVSKYESAGSGCCYENTGVYQYVLKLILSGYLHIYLFYSSDKILTFKNDSHFY